MPLTWEKGQVVNKAPEHDSAACAECAYWLEEYGEVIVDPTTKPPRHRGWYDGVHMKKHYMRFKV
jgi:hypothetical protein